MHIHIGHTDSHWEHSNILCAFTLCTHLCALGVHFCALGTHFYALGAHFHALGVHFGALGVHFCALGVHFHALGTHFRRLNAHFVHIHTGHTQTFMQKYNGYTHSLKNNRHRYTLQAGTYVTVSWCPLTFVFTTQCWTETTCDPINNTRYIG